MNFRFQYGIKLVEH